MNSHVASAPESKSSHAHSPDAQQRDRHQHRLQQHPPRAPTRVAREQQRAEADLHGELASTRAVSGVRLHGHTSAIVLGGRRRQCGDDRRDAAASAGAAHAGTNESIAQLRRRRMRVALVAPPATVGDRATTT